jgi:hypothetical protein
MKGSLSLSLSFRSFLFFENPFLNVDCGTFTFNPNVNYSLGCASTFVVVVVVATRQVKVWAEHIIFESVLSLQKNTTKRTKIGRQTYDDVAVVVLGTGPRQFGFRGQPRWTNA